MLQPCSDGVVPMRVPDFLRRCEISVEAVIRGDEPLEAPELLDVLPGVPPEALELAVVLVEVDPCSGRGFLPAVNRL